MKTIMLEAIRVNFLKNVPDSDAIADVVKHKLGVSKGRNILKVSKVSGKNPGSMREITTGDTGTSAEHDAGLALKHNIKHAIGNLPREQKVSALASNAASGGVRRPEIPKKPIDVPGVPKDHADTAIRGAVGVLSGQDEVFGGRMAKLRWIRRVSRDTASARMRGMSSAG